MRKLFSFFTKKKPTSTNKETSTPVNSDGLNDPSPHNPSFNTDNLSLEEIALYESSSQAYQNSQCSIAP